MSAPTAAWPTPALLTSLVHAEVPELEGRAGHGPLAILRALAACLPHGSADGTVTYQQVAEVAGYSGDHTRRCLHKLEALGLVVWSRGWRGHAGRMRIIKTAVVDLIRAGKRQARRLAGWVEAKTRRSRRSQGRTELPDISAAPTPLRGGNRRDERGRAVNHPPRMSVVKHRRNAMDDSNVIPINQPAFGGFAPARGRKKNAPTRSGAGRAGGEPAVAQGDARPCDVCHRPEHACRLANLKVPAAMRHRYVPVEVRR